MIAKTIDWLLRPYSGSSYQDPYMYMDRGQTVVMISGHVIVSLASLREYDIDR